MKKIALVLSMLMIMAVPCLALIQPLPIDGQVTYSDGTPASGVQVTITDTTTGEYKVYTTASDGRYLVDWANTINKYRDGDVFTIAVQGGNTVTKSYSTNMIDIVTNFILGSAPTQPTCPTQTCPTQSCPTVSCPTCETSTVPGTDFNSMVAPLLVGAAVGAIGGYTYTVTKNKKGKVTKVTLKPKPVPKTPKTPAPATPTEPPK